MSQRIFLSYESQDKEAATRLCDALEARGHACWIAPRNVSAGSNYGEAILDAIEDSAGMIVVLSRGSNASPHVANEVERAFHHNKPIYPVRIESVEPSRALEYFLSRKQWTDAFGGHWDAGMAALDIALQAGKPGEEFAERRNMVGRDAEAQHLERLARRLVESQRGCVVVIRGAAGIGKSRLLEWYANELAPKVGLQVLWGRHTYLDAAWEGIRNVLEDLFDGADLSREALVERVTASLENSEDAREEAAILTEVIRPKADSDGGIAGEQRVLEVVERTLTQASRRRPLAVLLEDIHLADSQSLKLLEHLAASLERRPRPLVVLATIRNEEADDHPALMLTLRALHRYGGKSYESINLDALDVNCSRDLIEQVLPGGLVPPDELIRYAGGRPLFLLEMLKHLRRKGLVSESGGAWALNPGVELSQEVPEDLAGMVEERIESLLLEHPEVEPILRYAAFIGEEFPLALLEEVLAVAKESTDVEALNDALLAFEGADLLQTRAEGSRLLIRFTHNLIYNALTEHMIRRLGGPLRTARAHGMVAQAKEHYYKEDIESVAFELSEHYAKARNAEKALAYAALSGWVAVSARCYPEAVRVFSRAATLRQADADALALEIANLNADSPRDFTEGFRMVLAKCLMGTLNAKSASCDLLDVVLKDLASTHGPKGLALASKPSDICIDFFNYLLQDEPRDVYWRCIKTLVLFAAELGRDNEDVLRRARLLDFLGFIAETTQRLTRTDRNAAAYAGKAADLYSEYLSRAAVEPRETLPIIEPASWCYYRARRHVEAESFLRRELEVLTELEVESEDVLAAMKAAAYHMLGLNALAHADASGGEYRHVLSEAAEHFLTAGEEMRRLNTRSWFARWMEALAEDIQKQRPCRVEMPVLREPGDVLLIHNHHDAAAADLVRNILEERGFYCVSSGPDRAWDPLLLEREYQAVVLFGSHMAPGMEGFSYLFRGEKDTWHLDGHLGECTNFGSWWQRGPFHKGANWFLAAGTTRNDTILAAAKLAREWPL